MCPFGQNLVEKQQFWKIAKFSSHSSVLKHPITGHGRARNTAGYPKRGQTSGLSWPASVPGASRPIPQPRELRLQVVMKRRGGSIPGEAWAFREMSRPWDMKPYKELICSMWTNADSVVRWRQRWQNDKEDVTLNRNWWRRCCRNVHTGPGKYAGYSSYERVYNGYRNRWRAQPTRWYETVDVNTRAIACNSNEK
jgi:hypothetical protein